MSHKNVLELLECHNKIILNEYFTDQCDNFNHISFNNQLFSKANLILFLISALNPHLVDKFLIKYGRRNNEDILALINKIIIDLVMQ